jgi:GNAT superfamily N-acetyltransferase
MITIIKAEAMHKKQVLTLLDDFRTACMAIYDPTKKQISTSAKEFGGELFDTVIISPDAAIFLAVADDKYIGIVSTYKIPQIRKGKYVAEIEEMYVDPTFQGKGVAQLLIDAVVTWTKEQKCSAIRLESENSLQRAHHFYEKAGFRLYGRGYIKEL